MEEPIKRIEELREQLGKVMDSQDKELRLQISCELDMAILEYIRRREI